ncbi:cell division protein [Rhodanobacter sp. FW510-R12]|uniref:peptidoglycan D,D-transpeptidase FtsI family protein n=1 Tax=unclassified Rhodanobacter TaxID=2621553 RepID=UPI0007AA281C|nr:MULTISPECIES: penicillin-binding protein 2 [unclassified Rhodanobacter]KZC17239.1 cell division protein [Rhodanobacter sp. FW104-R8]KZC29095.1 cell division protein [Rhodanobacter sp. FW510-T8]KZC33033.1 cell division protein [Rhodanobacter sp. FW510-R10]
MSWRNRIAPAQPGRRRGAGPSARRRMVVVVGLLGLVSVALIARAFDLQVVRKQFYQKQGDARFLREVPIPVSRGTIFDRNGEPLAVSTPMMSIWANPAEVLDSDEHIPALAQALGVDADGLKAQLAQRSDREFVYLRRQMAPAAAQAVLDLGIPGINGQREFKRYYPSGEVTAHVLGFTNIDDRGQEGLELAYDDWLAGKPGAKRVIRDRMGRVVEDIEQVRAPKPGQNLTLSIDRRIQFLAYSELKNALEKSQASSGSMVVLDVRTGEVLAMANLPTYNPNAIGGSRPDQRRNRAMTDVLEPGSTVKPILMAAALSSGRFTPTSPIIDTTGGHWYFQGHDIHDTHNYGLLTPTGVITKSSNVGAARIAMQLDTSLMYDTYRAFGLGNSTESGFPGEASGHLRIGRDWRPLEKAILGYGYGLNVTVLQLANAYATIADGGVMHSPTFIKGGESEARQIISAEVANQLIRMMETVTGPGSTGTLARIANYSVAGKTGTAHKASVGGYAKSNYTSAFAGIVPASNPRLVGVVVIDDPQKGSYYGGTVSGPVFSKVMEGALRLLDVPPDNIGRWYVGGPLQNVDGLVGSKPPADAPLDDAPLDGGTP